jgi:hypothetical protein
MNMSGIGTPRAVTDDEVAFFQENAWVHLPQLISGKQAAAALAHLQQIIGTQAERAQHPERSDGYEKSWNSYAPLSIDNKTGKPVDDVFYAFSHGREIGEVGARLLGSAVRYWIDQTLVKMPAGSNGSDFTYWHRDVGSWDTTPFDPPDQCIIWIALGEITPARGSMRFIAPRFQDDAVWEVVNEHSVVDSYPIFEEMGVISPPLHLKPGDATVHRAVAMHSAPPNTTEIPRWSYLVGVIPAHARFTGNPFWAVNGVEGIEAGSLFPEHRYPVLAEH